MKIRVVIIISMMGLVIDAIGGSVPSYNLDDPAEPWRLSKSGVSTRVLSPYTPLIRNKNIVECWGRSYELGAVFPASVTSQGQSVLSAPVALNIKTNGKWITLTGLYPTFGLQRKDRIEFSSVAAAGLLEISVNGWIEYDGLVRLDLKLAPNQAVVVEGIDLVFPFTLNAALFYHLETLWGPHIYKRSPTSRGVVASYNWQPLVWVGNHDIGFTVVTETCYGWTSANNAIELKRNEKSFDLTYHIITKPVKLTGEKCYTFGLQATPVKPMRPDRWSIVIGTLPGENLRLLEPNPLVEPLFSYPQPSDFNRFAELVSDWHRQGVRSCYYITTSATSNKSEVNKRNHEEWLISKTIFSGGEWKIGKGLIGADSCCPASNFSDFMAWAVERAMTTFDIDGIYIDNPGPYRCENGLHGCGTGGVETQPYFALRDLHKRIYTIVKTQKPDGFVWEHTSQRFNSLQMSWIDIYSDGEHFRETKYYPRQHLDAIIDRTYLEITATGHQMGVLPVFLSSMTVREDRKEGEWSEWLLSRLLPFGQMVWARQGWMDVSPARAVANARAEFGLGKETIRFYRAHELPSWLVLTAPQPIIACMWQRQRDKASMILLANWNNTAMLIRVSRNEIIRQFGVFAMKDSLTGAEIPNEYLMIAVPANSFRMLTITSRR